VVWCGVRWCDGWCGHMLKGRCSNGDTEPNKYVQWSEALPHLGGKRLECACGVRQCKIVQNGVSWCGIA
jgi:hypothetical protein